MKFSFGEPYGSNSVKVDAKDLCHAIKIFKVSELFPEKCVDSTFYTNSEGSFTRQYDSRLSRYNYNFNTSNPLIFIYRKKENSEEWEKISEITR